MKCAALLNGSGSVLSSKRFIERWTGKNKSKKIPASAITNFLATDEKRILFMISLIIKIWFKVRNQID